METVLAEDRCEACGKAVHPEGLSPWTTTERRRVFKGSQARQGGGPLYDAVEATRTVRVCEACAGRLAAGEDLHELHSRRVNRQMILFALMLVLIALLTPVLLPYVRTALFLNR